LIEYSSDLHRVQVSVVVTDLEVKAKIIQQWFQITRQTSYTCTVCMTLETYKTVKSHD